MVSNIGTRIYAGHRREETTGLDYMQARWYTKETGTFMSVDPVVPSASDPQSYNAYAYARNNPISLIDPAGTSWLDMGLVTFEPGPGPGPGPEPEPPEPPDQEVVVRAPPYGGIPWYVYQKGTLMGLKAWAARSTAYVPQTLSGLEYVSFGSGSSQSGGLSSGSSTSPTPSGTPGSGGLDANSNAAVTAQAFAKHAAGKTLHELQTEVPGSRLFPNLGAGGPDSSVRFVLDPADPSRVIDMRHFLVVGPRGVAFGYAVEIGQALGFHPSAFNAQDFFSNRVGAEFFNSNFYNPSIPRGVGNQIQNFLLSPGRR